MLYKKVENGCLLRLERGEEVMTSLLEFIRKFDIKSGFMVGLGACEELKLGYFDAVKGEYKDKEFKGEYEVTNLTGNIAWLEDGNPIAHVHITLSDEHFRAVAGHLWSGKVSGTVEIHITAFKNKILRTKDSETGLNLLDLEKAEL
jgi:uncharacterized protein